MRGPTPRSSLHAVSTTTLAPHAGRAHRPRDHVDATKVGNVLVTLSAVEPRPDTQPELTWVSHAWRYALCLVFSAAVWQTVAAAEWRDHRLLFTVEVVLGVGDQLEVGDTTLVLEVAEASG